MPVPSRPPKRSVPSPISSPNIRYADAGVDIDAGNKAVEMLKKHVATTRTPAVLADVGSFGGCFAFEGKVLVASTDGVGTKLKLAFLSGRHDTIGEDLVNHCVNDILVMGARPLFFLDYIATGKVRPSVIADIVKGFSVACRQNGCAIIGGETAELPGFYKDGEYDIAGFIVGSVDKDKLIDAKKVTKGDVLIGLASSGLQTNGYSLALRVLAPKKADLALVGTLMTPHSSFLKPVTAILDAGIKVHGMAHITGGGFVENIPRILPSTLAAKVSKGSWQVPDIFSRIQRQGPVDEQEMYRVFNMGIGMVLAIDPKDAKKAISLLVRADQKAWRIGEVVSGKKNVLFV